MSMLHTLLNLAGTWPDSSRLSALEFDDFAANAPSTAGVGTAGVARHAGTYRVCYKSERRSDLILTSANRAQHPGQVPASCNSDCLLERASSALDYVPRGGGDSSIGHRCAGERITIARFAPAGASISFDVPEPDLSFSLARMPTHPRRGVCVANVRQRRSVDGTEGIEGTALQKKAVVTGDCC